ncbi:MAG TPA: Rrf2 family transcriptional regulator [Spirochaetota bacterium]|nr:Rrf2 family transcriptional regulator [Spirochaetota bacterium]
MINSDFALSVHALLLLATYEGELLTSGRLSELLKVHPVRIRKVLSKMKSKGYIDSKEGSSGGFSISCNISAVSLKEIYLLNQEDLLKPKCHDCCVSCKIGSNIENVLDDILSGADDKFQEYLEKYSLKSVLEKL